MGKTFKIDRNIGTTKLIDVGNSRGLILSKLLLAIADWHKGDMLDAKYIRSEDIVVITNVTKVMKRMEKAHMIENKLEQREQGVRNVVR